MNQHRPAPQKLLTHSLNRSEEQARELDHADKANLRQAADMASLTGEHSIEQRRKLARLVDSPYFGRIDVTDGVRLIDAESENFSGGVIISAACLAKGLEFDQVIVPFAGEKEYRSEIDRHLLYVAVTRAMHDLAITHTGPASPFLQMVGMNSGCR